VTKIGGRTRKASPRKPPAPWLSTEIVYRPKESFGAWIQTWISYDLAELADDVLLSGDLVGRGFPQRVPLQRLVEEERSGREDRSKQIWQLLALELWCRQAVAAGATP